METKAAMLGGISDILAARRLAAQKLRDARFAEVCGKIPEYGELDGEAKRLGVELCRLAIPGGQSGSREDKKKLLEENAGKRSSLLINAGFPENYLEDVFTCAKCHDTGTVTEDGRQVKCECVKKLYSELCLENCGITPDAGLDSFDLSYYTGDGAAAAKRALADAKKFTENFGGEGMKDIGNMLILGGTGVGKTYLASCMTYELVKRGVQTVFMTASQMMTEMTYYGENAERAKRRELLETLVFEADVLVIDDLGAERMSEACFKILLDILNRRTSDRNSGLRTIVTTNLKMKDIMKTYDERIFSRLCSFSNYLLTASDIRLGRR